MDWQYFIPTKIIFGPGVLRELHKQPLPGKTALIVTTNGKSVQRCGYLPTLCGELDQAGIRYHIFHDVSQNPTVENVTAGAAMAKENGCDFVISLGGGSALDAGKAIAMMAVNPGSIWDYFMACSGGRQTPKNAPLPFVAIPTTAGTGSETDGGFVINNLEKGEKLATGGPGSFPKLSIIDPELTASVPPRFTAFQGYDVLCHAMECYLSKNAMPLSDAIIPEILRRVGTFLPRAVADGGDMEARSEMAAASAMAGMCLAMSTLTLQHAMEHALSGVYHNLVHGCGLALLSRAYLTNCASKEVYRPRMARMADALLSTTGSQPEDLIRATEELKAACGIGGLRMADFGVKAEDFPRIIAGSHTRHYDNERLPVTDSEVERILYDAMQ